MQRSTLKNSIFPRNLPISIINGIKYILLVFLMYIFNLEKGVMISILTFNLLFYFSINVSYKYFFIILS